MTGEVEHLAGEAPLVWLRLRLCLFSTPLLARSLQCFHFFIQAQFDFSCRSRYNNFSVINHSRIRPKEQVKSEFNVLFQGYNTNLQQAAPKGSQNGDLAVRICYKIGTTF